MKYVNLALLTLIALMLIYIGYKHNMEMFELNKRDYSDCSGEKLSADYEAYMLDDKSFVSHVPELPYEATCPVFVRPGNH